MTNNNLLKKFTEYDKDKPQKVTEISGLLGIPINGHQQVEVPNRNGFVYVRLRNSTNELIQAFNEKVSSVYGLPVLVKWNVNRYEVQGRDTSRYQDWGSFSAFLPRHGSQHSLNFEDGQGGDVSFIYSRQFMPFATIPSGTDGAGTVFVMPHVYRAPNASWNYIGNESSQNFLPAKPTGTSARMMLLVWDLSTSDPLIITGSFFAENLTGTSAILPYVPTVTNQNYIPLAAIRLVSGTQSLLWNNIYDMRQYAVTTPSPFAGGFAVQDEGVPVGTGTTLNFVGDNVVASVSGSVVRVFVTGTAFSGVDQIGVYGYDDSTAIGTGTSISFGRNLNAVRSGTVIFVDSITNPISGNLFLPFAAYANLSPLSVSPSAPFAVTIDRTMTLIKWAQAIHVVTTNNVSNYWNIELRTMNSTFVDGINTSGTAVDTDTLFIDTTFDIASVDAADKSLYITCTKVGAPGNLYLQCPLIEVSI